MASQIHKERLIEEAIIEADLLRAKIPARVLVLLEQQDDEQLGKLAQATDMPEELRTFAGWEAKHRRVHGITVTYDHQTAQTTRREGKSHGQR
jgi:hypothetical protein